MTNPFVDALERAQKLLVEKDAEIERLTAAGRSMIPIEELINSTDVYTCSRNLFPFVNRSLNAMGLRAHILDARGLDVALEDDFPIRFMVGKNS